MSELDAADSQAPRPSVFLSYASEDREAARLLRDALPGYGLDVWYDESDLGGGEAWDQKIRRQIRECSYFMPLISAQTERRHEGYFRREWRLAVERTLDIADDHLFLLPIALDDTDQAFARVPEKFLSVQWLKVQGGQPNRALEAMCRRIASGSGQESSRAPIAAGQPTRVNAAASRSKPEFPREEPGQRVRFWVAVAAWAAKSAWAAFNRVPRWIRLIVYLWIGIALLSRCHSSSTHRASSEITPAKMERLKAISDKYQGASSSSDIARLSKQIADDFDSDSDDEERDGSPLLAIAFTAPAGDAPAKKLADSTFAMAYGMIAISHHAQVRLTKDPLPSRELGAALERGRANHSKYVLCGAVEMVDGADMLTIKIAAVADGSVVWSKSYAANADPAKIAADVNANIPALGST